MLLLLLSHFSRVRLCVTPDGSPPGSPVPGILQARTLEWVAISFSNAWKWKVKVKSLSRVQLFATPQTAAYQALRSRNFPGKSTGVGCHCLLQQFLLNSEWGHLFQRLLKSVSWPSVSFLMGRIFSVLWAEGLDLGRAGVQSLQGLTDLQALVQPHSPQVGPESQPGLRDACDGELQHRIKQGTCQPPAALFPPPPSFSSLPWDPAEHLFTQIHSGTPWWCARHSHQVSSSDSHPRPNRKSLPSLDFKEGNPGSESFPSVSKVT